MREDGTGEDWRGELGWDQGELNREWEHPGWRGLPVGNKVGRADAGMTGMEWLVVEPVFGGRRSIGGSFEGGGDAKVREDMSPLEVRGPRRRESHQEGRKNREGEEGRLLQVQGECDGRTGGKVGEEGQEEGDPPESPEQGEEREEEGREREEALHPGQGGLCEEAAPVGQLWEERRSEEQDPGARRIEQEEDLSDSRGDQDAG